MKEPQRSLCKCPVEITDSTPTSTDNSNTSSSLRLSERIRSQRTRKVFQGQPRRLVILGATFTTAKLYFEQVGSPYFYNVVLTSSEGRRHTYQFTGAQYSNFGNYLFVTGLTPNTVYTVELYLTYESGDVFPVNHTKTFRTSLAEGAVKDLVLKNPTNRVFSIELPELDADADADADTEPLIIDATNQTTEFSLEFTPLRDRVDYRIYIPELQYDVTISYETIIQYDLYSQTISGNDLSFNKEYHVIVETLYGVDNDQYAFDASATIVTLDENYYLQSNMEINNLYNQSIDISYQPVQTIPNIQHFFYINGEKYSNIEYYENRVTILQLLINTPYTLAISTFFPESQNEYIDNVHVVEFTTLNESPPVFVYSSVSPLIKNDFIEISYLDPSGTLFDLIPSIEPVNGNFQFNTIQRKLIYSSLPINTEFTVKLEVLYNETGNRYAVEEKRTTLNQNTVSNLIVRQSELLYKSKALINFTSSPGFLSIKDAYYHIEFGDSISFTLSNKSTRTIVSNLDRGTYNYNISSIYPSINTATPIIPSYKYSISGEVFIDTLEIGNLIPIFTIYGDRVLIEKDPVGFINHNYYSVKVISISSNQIIYNPGRIYNWNNESNTLMIPKLSPDTSYEYTIVGYYDNNTDFSSNNTGTFRTLNEASPTISIIKVGVYSVDIVTENVVDDDVSLNQQYLLNDSIVQFKSPSTTLNWSGLDDPNTTYYGKIINFYPSNSYEYNYSFTTLFAGAGTVNSKFVFNHPIYGNSAIMSIVNVNPSEATYNILNVEIDKYDIDDNYNVDINGFIQIPNVHLDDEIFASVTTGYKEPKSNSFITYEYEENPYISDQVLFTARMVEFISIVKYNEIEIRWMDLNPTEDISYSVQWSTSSVPNSTYETILSHDVNQYTITGLTRNTIYDISFTRLIDPSPIVQSKTLQTLNEGPASSLSHAIVLNTGLGGKNITLDLNDSNINSPAIMENRFRLIHPDSTVTEYSSDTNVFDVTLPDTIEVGDTLTGTITTIYKPTPTTLSSPYEIYETPANGYESDPIQFTIESEKTPFVFNNGNLEPANGPYQFNELNGLTNTSSTVFPEYFTGTGVIFADNSNGTLYGHRYLDRPGVNQHALFFVDDPVQEPAYIEQSIMGGYLFRNYYSLAFFIARHLVENVPFNTGNPELPYKGGITSPTVEYKAQIVDSNGVVFQTNPLIADDLSWNQIQIKFYLANSCKDVKLRIQRNYYELNHLLLSDISMVSIGASFEPVPSLEYSRDRWHATSSEAIPVDDISWNDFYSESSLQLSTNMTLGFWFYAHPIVNEYQERVFILVGDSTATYQANNVLSFYVKNNRVYFENQSHLYTFKRHSIFHKYQNKIPIFYQIVYTNGQVIVYENGNRLQEYRPATFLKEANVRQNLYVGNTNRILPFGPIIRDIRFYNYPFNDNQIHNTYEGLKIPYSIIGNYTDIAPYEIFNIRNDTSLVFANRHDIHYNMNNGTVLPKTLFFTSMNGQTIDWNYTLTTPFSFGLWYKPEPRKKNLNETLVLFTSADDISLLSLKQNGDILEFRRDGFSDVNIEWKQPTNTLEHIVCTVDDSNIIHIYKNGYLYYSTPTTAFGIPTQTSIAKVVIGDPSYLSSMADLHVYSKSMSQEEVFTIYLNYYRIASSYDINSGNYVITIPKVVGSNDNNIAYSLNSPTVTTFTVPLQGTITLDELSNEYRLLVSMDYFDRNRFHKVSSESFVFNLPVQNISRTITGTNNPYIDATYFTHPYVEEGAAISVVLRNISTDDPDVVYTYNLSGTDITEKDISGGYLTGTLVPDVVTEIVLREDYKTEDIESLIITVDSLYLSTTVDISDNTTNLLTVDNPLPNIGEQFTVTLTWPYPTNLPNSIEYEIISDYVTPNGSGTFEKGLRESVPFTVRANTPIEEPVTMTLKNYDSTVELVLNNVPQLKLSKLNEPNTTSIDEGDTFVLTMFLPQEWDGSKPNVFEYSFNTTDENNIFNTNDIASTTDSSFIFDTMSGQFVFDIDNGIREISYNFVTAQNLNTEQDEEIFVALKTVGYTNTVSNVLTINDTAKPPSYILNVSVSGTENNEDPVIINESDTFTVTLIPTNSSPGIFNYNIVDISGSITSSDFETGELTGSFIIRDVGETILPDDLVKTFTLRNDVSIEGDEEFEFQIVISNTLTIAKRFRITDTSVKPVYSITDQVDEDNTTITIRITCTNHNLLTESQRNISLDYVIITSNTLNITSIDGNAINKLGSFIFGNNSEIEYIFSYSGTGDFAFQIGEISTSQTIT